MFRSAAGVIVSQAEHARLAGAIAAVWGLPQPLPFESLVRGVTLHDRGYGELDDDEIGAVEPERWVEIQRRGFTERSGDAVVDLLVALHIRRLIGDDGHPARAAFAHEIDATLPELRTAAGVGEEEAGTADGVTEVCDGSRSSSAPERRSPARCAASATAMTGPRRSRSIRGRSQCRGCAASSAALPPAAIRSGSYRRCGCSRSCP